MMGSTKKEAITLFVDGISRKTSLTDIRTLFETCGDVVDVYIAGKRRQNINVGFGFVRYKLKQDALKAIEYLNGFRLNGSSLKIGMAQYQKGGQRFVEQPPIQKKIEGEKRQPTRPAHRDQRQYREVLMGESKNGPKEKHSADQKQQVTHTIKVVENPTMSNRLKLAAVVVFVEFIDPHVAVSLINNTDVQYTFISSLSPCKYILCFDDETSLEYALEDTSPLWLFACDVHRWDDNECLMDRLAWLELSGVHPKSWSSNNFKSIMERWGKLLYIDHDFLGVNSLTSAKVLIQTKQKGRIDEYIKLEWGIHSCEIWVREVDGDACLNVGQIIEQRCKKYEDYEQHSVEPDGKDSGTQREYHVNKEVMAAHVEVVDCLERDLQDNNGAQTNTHENQNKKDDKVVVMSNNKAELDLSMTCPLADQQLAGIYETTRGNFSTSVTLDPMDHESLLAYGTDNHCNTAYNTLSVQQFSTPSVTDFVDCAWYPELGNQLPNLPPHRYDPMVQIEWVSQHQTAPAEGIKQKVEDILGYASTSKKPRGRPKKFSTNSLPCTQPLCPPNTSEIDRTWKTVNLIGIDSKEDMTVMTELRKSRRIAKRVETTH